MIFNLKEWNDMQDFQINNCLEVAASLCLKIHKGVTDRTGQPAFLQALRIVAKCKNNNERIVAFLNGIFETSNLTPDDLIKLGFSSEMVDAIQSLSKNDSEEEEHYIHRLALNSLARTVKMYSLEDKFNIEGWGNVVEADVVRLNEYAKLYAYLSNLPKEICVLTMTPVAQEATDSNVIETESETVRNDVNKHQDIMRDGNTEPDSKDKHELQYQGKRFFINTIGCNAKGILTNDGEIVISKGSIIRKEVTNSYANKDIRENILEIFCEEMSYGYLVETDMPPMSPSMASGLVQGRSSNGKTDWIDEKGISLIDFLSRTAKDDEIIVGQNDEKAENSAERTVKKDTNNEVESIDEIFPQTSNVVAVDVADYAYDNEGGSIEEYLQKFRQMKVNSILGLKGPYKPMMLYTILECYRVGYYNSRKVFYSKALEKLYNKIWNEFLIGKEYVNLNPAYPFVELEQEPFFRLEWKKILKDFNYTWNRKAVSEHVNFAIIDHDLYNLISIPSNLEKLQDFLKQFFFKNTPPIFAQGDENKSKDLVFGNKKKNRETWKIDRFYFRRYLNSSSNKYGRPYSGSTISIYISALTGGRMAEYILKYSSRSDIFLLNDFSILRKIMIDLERDWEHKTVSKVLLRAFEVFLEFVKFVQSTEANEVF